MDILVRKKGEKEWRKVREQAFESEAALQNILYESPEIIPIEELGENLLKPILFIKEAGLPGSGSTDLVGIDEEGGITIIECKLATNREIRRQVVGQVLEYAAYVWQMDYEQFDSICCKAERWEGKHLIDAMREKIEDPEKGLSEEEFKSNVASALQKGDFRLIIAVDALNDELRRIIQFLNSRGRSAPQIYALEMRQFRTSELQMLVPELFGAVTIKPSEQGEVWDEEKFFRKLEANCEPATTEIVRKLHDFTIKKADLWSWGRGRIQGSFTYYVLRDSDKISIFSVNTEGWLGLNFGTLKSKGIRQEAIEGFRTGLNEILGITIGPDVLSGNKYPSVPVKVLAEPSNRERFQKTVLALCEEVKRFD